MEQIDQLLLSKQSRRRFLAGAGAVSAVGAATLLTGCNDSTTSAAPTPAPTPAPLDIPDNDILNFALNLEYLEAEFYLYAATGSGIPSALALSGAGTTKGGVQVTGSTEFQGYLNQIAQDEMNHIMAIQATITANSGTPVARPNIDFTDAFNTLATTAKISGGFNPFSSPQAFVVGGFTLTDVGVTAYNGAAPLLQSNIILDAAAGIVAIEAYHASLLRAMIAGQAFISGDPTYLNYANMISAVRATLGGGMETAVGTSSIVAADPTNAIGYARTTSEVLSIIYGNSTTGTKQGGFFPSGINGNITTV